jgi:hypothetical protein
MTVDDPKDRLYRTILEISVDNFIRFASLENSCESKHCKR